MNIKDIQYQVVEITHKDDSIKYAILVTYKSKGSFWGWNEKCFFVEKDYEDNFIDNYDTFDQAHDRQETIFNAFKHRIFKCETEIECQKEIENFDFHVKKTEEIKNKTVIKEIKILK